MHLPDPFRRDPIPDEWEFPLEFLADPAKLPPHVPSADAPGVGTSRRARRADLAPLCLEFGRPLVPHACYWANAHMVVDEGRHHGLTEDSTLVLREELLNRHLLLVGPPGSGKTSRGVQPLIRGLLCDRDRTLVVFDPKGDQFGLLHELARNYGWPSRRIRRIALTDPAASCGWNPLRRGMSRTEAMAIAATLVMASENRASADSPFWRNMSTELISDLLLGLAADPAETLTLPRVLEVLNLPRPHLLRWLRGHGLHKFAAFLESGSHNAETCLCDAGMRLLPLLDLDLCAVLSHDEFLLDDLFRTPQLLVISVSEARSERLRPLVNLLVQQLLERAIEATERRRDGRLPFPVTLVLDEFGSAIGTLPRFPVHLNTLRSRRVSVLAAVQSLGQIHALYGADAKAVLGGFASTVWFPGLGAEDAEAASRMSGTMVAEVRTPDGKVHWLPRPVYLPDEIARPKEHPVLGRPITLMLADVLPFQAYVPPSYRMADFHEPYQRQHWQSAQKLRRAPLVYVPPPPPVDLEPVGARSLAAGDVAARLQAEEARLLAAVGEPAAAAWRSFRQRAGARSEVALAVLEELRQRGAGLGDFAEALRGAGVDEPQVVLKFLDYLLARRRLDRRREAQ